ncbi:hypothetical protein M885DRAFT_510812 [Pelagophyceae sp. CCMP2097]|nr:hypothetical protein M885DRAFT_510812 [Pelagophyceae sp. CCMP2097]
MHLVAVVVSLLVPLSRRAALHTAKQKTRTALHAARQAAHPLLDGAEALRVRRDGAAFFAQAHERGHAAARGL